jgi:hypothetical protein
MNIIRRIVSAIALKVTGCLSGLSSHKYDKPVIRQIRTCRRCLNARRHMASNLSSGLLINKQLMDRIQFATPMQQSTERRGEATASGSPRSSELRNATFRPQPWSERLNTARLCYSLSSTLVPLMQSGKMVAVSDAAAVTPHSSTAGCGCVAFRTHVPSFISPVTRHETIPQSVLAAL